MGARDFLCAVLQDHHQLVVVQLFGLLLHGEPVNDGQDAAQTAGQKAELCPGHPAAGAGKPGEPVQGTPQQNQGAQDCQQQNVPEKKTFVHIRGSSDNFITPLKYHTHQSMSSGKVCARQISV